jgi:OmpR family response regulator RpaB
VQNILRRNQSAQAVIYQWSDLQLDIEAKQLRRNDEVVPLTAAEFSLLSLLAQNQHRILSRDEIMRELRGIDADIFSRAIDVLVSRLRSKLQQPELIRTVRGLGYQLVPR